MVHGAGSFGVGGAALWLFVFLGGFWLPSLSTVKVARFKGHKVTLKHIGGFIRSFALVKCFLVWFYVLRKLSIRLSNGSWKKYRVSLKEIAMFTNNFTMFIEPLRRRVRIHVILYLSVIGMLTTYVVAFLINTMYL